MGWTLPRLQEQQLLLEDLLTRMKDVQTREQKCNVRTEASANKYNNSSSEVYTFIYYPETNSTICFLVILSKGFLLRTDSLINIPFGDCVTRQTSILRLEITEF